MNIFKIAWAVYYLSLSIMGAIILASTDPHISFIDCAFQSVSAASGGGLTTIAMSSLTTGLHNMYNK